MKTEPAGGAHAAGDRLREFIDEMVSEASERQGQAEVYRIMREWSHEEASEAEARALTKWAKKLTTVVRELVPVPPQPVKETVRKAYTDGMSEAWAIAKNSEAPNGVLRAIDARISEWASQEPEVDHRETIAALKAELANHSPSDFHRPSSTCPDGELHKLRCIRCEIPGISAVPPAPQPTALPDQVENSIAAVLATCEDEDRETAHEQAWNFCLGHMWVIADHFGVSPLGSKESAEYPNQADAEARGAFGLTAPSTRRAVPPAPSGAPNPEIEAFWQGVQRGWDIEPREYFEREAPKNGFRFPIAQALHHIWKRCVTENPPFGVAAPAPSAAPFYPTTLEDIVVNPAPSARQACPTFSEAEDDAERCKHCGWSEEAHNDQPIPPSAPPPETPT